MVARLDYSVYMWLGVLCEVYSAAPVAIPAIHSASNCAIQTIILYTTTTAF